MAKKAKKTVEPVKEILVQEPKKEIKKEPKNKWEIKDRNYYLVNNKTPLTLTIPSRHTSKVPLLWFDPISNEQKELRYATNQPSPFVAEQKGEATLGHITFKNGTLTVPKEEQNLQKLLSLYHPKLNVLYTEFDAVEEAKDELADLDLQIEALNAARDIEIDHAEAILRVELGSQVATMSSKEIRRDLLLFAKRKPDLFLDLASDDNVELRNIAIVAQELGIISLSQDQRTFSWGSNGKKLMTVPFDENPYSAMAQFFKTDEGTEVFKSIQKKLK